MTRLSLWWRSMAVALLPSIIVAVLMVGPSYRAWRHGVPIIGHITQLEPENHRTVRYEYTYRGTTYRYSSQGGAGVGNPGFHELRPGSEVQLWVDPAAPATALPGDPGPPMRDNAIFTVAVFGAVSLISGRYWTKQRRESAPSAA